MKTLALALATAATLGLAAPAFAQADVTVRSERPTVHKKIVIKHEERRGWHRDHHYGWGAHRSFGSTEKIVIKKKPGRTVIKKFD
jgi:hypothetical protein